MSWKWLLFDVPINPVRDRPPDWIFVCCKQGGGLHHSFDERLPRPPLRNYGTEGAPLFKKLCTKPAAACQHACCI